MSETQRKYLIRANVFAIGYQLLMMLIVLLLGGYAHAIDGTSTFKATFTIGLPMLDQLLDPGHQITFSTNWSSPVFLLWTVLITVVFAWVNGFYIALLARSTDDLPDTPVQQANRFFFKLLLWTIAQMGVTLLCTPLIVILHMFGGVLAMVLLLWFRYAFMFFEYTVVVQGAGFIEALDECRVIRRRVPEEATKYFVGIVVFNIVVAFLVNGLFSVPVVLFFLLVHTIIMTLTQHNLLRIFNRATS